MEWILPIRRRPRHARGFARIKLTEIATQTVSIFRKRAHEATERRLEHDGCGSSGLLQGRGEIQLGPPTVSSTRACSRTPSPPGHQPTFRAPPVSSVLQSSYPDTYVPLLRRVLALAGAEATGCVLVRHEIQNASRFNIGGPAHS